MNTILRPQSEVVSGTKPAPGSNEALVQYNLTQIYGDKSLLINEITTDKNNEKLGPSGDKLKWLEEPSYFFKLSKWQDKLLNFYKILPFITSSELVLLEVTL